MSILSAQLLSHFLFTVFICQYIFYNSSMNELARAGRRCVHFTKVDIVARRNAVDVTNYVTNGEWWLLSTSIERHAVIYSIGPAAYPDVTVSLNISRRVFYYVFNIIVPCVWLNLLSLLAFCMPPDAGEKAR